MSEAVLSRILLAAVLTPFAAGAVMATLREHKHTARAALSIGATVIVAGLVAVLAGPVARGGVIGSTPYRVSPMLALNLSVDRLGLLFGLTASSLWVLTTIYSQGYMAGMPHRSRYFTFLTLSLGATLGVAWAGNLFTLYAFYELLTLMTFPLVVYEKGPEVAAAGRAYIAYSLVGASLVLLGITGTLILGGSLDFQAGGLLAGIPVTPGVYLTAFFFIAGFGVKGALMPMHGWLPQAMVAPTPVSALLHAVAVVKSGVFGILRVLFFVFGRDLLARSGIGVGLLVAAGGTILLGSLSALRQDVLKRRLAYSTISQLAYITFGVATLTGAGMVGGLLHLMMHALMKITLFFCAGLIITQTGRTRISQLDGIGRRMPLTMGAFTIAALGMVGVAPICGFVSKWYLLLGSAGAIGWGGIALLSASSLLNAAYFFPIIVRAFFRHWREEDGQAADAGQPGLGHGTGNGSTAHGGGHGAGAKAGQGEAPRSMLWPVLLLAALCLAAGLWPQLPLDLVRRLVGNL